MGKVVITAAVFAIWVALSALNFIVEYQTGNIIAAIDRLTEAVRKGKQ